MNNFYLLLKRKHLPGLFSLVFLLFLMSGKHSYAQFTLTGTNYTQNFNGVGAGLPSGWNVFTSANSTALGTAQTFNTTAQSWNGGTGNFVNFASTTSTVANGGILLTSASTPTNQSNSTNRALGIQQVSAFGDPGASVGFWITNTTGFSNFTLSFSLQQGSTTGSRTTTWLVDYGFGVSPSTFTSVATTPPTISTTNGTWGSTIVTVNFGGALDNITQNVWIRIRADVASTGSGSRPATGIDDFNLNWTLLSPADVNITSLNPAAPAASIAPGSVNNLLYRTDLQVTTANANLTSASFTTSAGYAAADITNFKLWYQTTSTFTGAGTLLGTKSTVLGPGIQLFSGLSQLVPSGSTGYLFLTADISCAASAGANFNVAAVGTGNFTFVSANKTAVPAPSAGGLQTITAFTLSNVTGPAAAPGNGQLSISWTNPSCFDEIMLLATDNPGGVSSVPTGDGTAYTQNLQYNDGTNFANLNPNEYCIYKGGISPQIMSGLINGTLYYIKLFTRKGTNWSAGIQISGTPSAIVFGDFRSATSGIWNVNTTWEKFTGTWVPAGAGEYPNSNTSNVTIRNTHTVTYSQSGYSIKDLTVDLGGKLYSNSTTANKYLSVFGNIICNGIIGNSPGLDDISFNIEAANCLITGTGNFSCMRVRKNTGVNSITNLTVDMNVTANWPTTSVYNAFTGAPNAFNITINAGKTLTCGNGSSFAIDGTNGAAFGSSYGGINVNGTLLVQGTLYMTTNNTAPYNCFVNIGATGVINANTVTMAASGGTGTHTLTIANGGKLNITGTAGISPFSSSQNIYTLNSGSIVEYSAAGATPVESGLSYSNLIISGSGTKTANGNISVGNIFTLSAGLFNINGLLLNMAANGTITGNGGNFDAGAAAGTSNFLGNGTINGTTALTFNNLTINTGTVSTVLTNCSGLNLNLVGGVFNIGIGNRFNILTGGTVAATSGDFSVGTAGGILNFNGTGTFSGNSNPYDVYASGGVNFGAGNVTIQNGGSFRINFGGTATLNGPIYADGSTLIYNTGVGYLLNNNTKEWISGLTGLNKGVPAHVTLMTTGTSVSFNIDGAARTMRGNLLINNGTTFSLSTNSGGDLNIAGNWTRNATGAFVHNNRMVTFNGTASNQTITVTGGGTETFGYLQVNKSVLTFPDLILAGAPNATNITIFGSASSNSATYTLMLIRGNIDLNQNTLNFNGFNGNSSNVNNIQVDGTSTGPNWVRYINSTGGQGTFAVYNSNGAGSSQILIERTANALRRLEFSANVRITINSFCGLSFGYSLSAPVSTINGILQINTNGYVHTYAPIYGNNSTLIYNTGGAFNRNVEWGTNIQPGYPFHVLIQNNSNITLNTLLNGNDDRALAGNLTVQNGSGLILGATYANKLTVGGSLVLNGSLTLPTVIGGDLYVASDWTRSATGVFNPNDRAVFFNGTGNSNLTANNGELFPYIYLTKSVVGNTLFLNNDMRVSKELGISTGTLDLINSNTIMKSDVNATASLGKFTASGAVTYTGTGRFIVERFIATNAAPTSNPYHDKSWQLLAIPVDSTGTLQTINQAWQEGNAPLVPGTAGLGTIISNNTAGTGGFDIVGGSGPSMKTFVPATSTWAGISGTNIRHYNQKGYMILVRGDRTVTTSSALSNPTTLRTRGRIFNPANVPPTTNVGVTQFESIGNPYPSAIDFSNIAGVVKTGSMQDVFYLWDPRLGGAYNLGGYQTFTKVVGPGTDYTVSPGGGSYGASASVSNIIQSGQAFFVHSFGGSGTISFNENAKVSGSNLVHRIITPNPQQESSLRTNLYNASGNKPVLVDGVVHDFGRNYSNGLDILDALKMRNTSENLGIRCGTEILAVERRGLIQKLDTLRFDLTQTRVANYTFEFYPKNFSGNSLRAYLVDNYLQTKTTISLSDTSRVTFRIENIPGSYAADRFMLIFLNGGGPVFTQLNAENTDKDILVKWTVPAGQSGTYDVERSADGINFETLQEGITAGSTLNNWRDSDPLPGLNYYRIHHLSASADMGYSNKVRLSTLTAEETIAVYPNPVVNGRIGVRFNNAEKGQYQLRLIGMEGKSISNFSLFHNAHTEKKSVQLPAGIPAGIYSLEITAPSGVKQTLHVVVAP